MKKPQTNNTADFRPSAAARNSQKGESRTESRSAVFAVAMGVMGFRPRLYATNQIKRVRDAKTGLPSLSETGPRGHVFLVDSEHSMPCFDGTAGVLRSNFFRSQLTQPSKRGRLCLLDDTFPEHPVLYCVQTALNYRALMRTIHEGAPLYQYTWNHTTRTALINDDRYEPYAYLFDEMNVNCGQLEGRSEYSVIKPTGTDITTLDGVSDRTITRKAPVAAALSAAGFEVVPHAWDSGQASFIVSKKARVATASTEKEPAKYVSAIWDSENIRELIGIPSIKGRANALEDIDPEHPVLYGGNTILGLRDLVDAIRECAKKPLAHQIVSDKTPMTAFLQEGNAKAFDRLKKMFSRSGDHSRSPKLI